MFGFTDKSPVFDGFGAEDIKSFFDSAWTVADAVKDVCLPLVSIAMLLLVAITLTKWAMGEYEFDYRKIGGFLLLLIFLTTYKEVMDQVINIGQYLVDGLDQGVTKITGGQTIAEKSSALLIQNAKAKDWSFTQIMDGFFPWLMSNFTLTAISTIRGIILVIREITIVILIAVGPVAITLSMFPLFSSAATHWFKLFFSVYLWLFTAKVLDILFAVYLDNAMKRGDHEGFLLINLGMILMYCAVPHLTSKFLGGVHAQSMQRIVSTAVAAGGMGAAMASKFAAGKAQQVAETVGSASNTLSSVPVAGSGNDPNRKQAGFGNSSGSGAYGGAGYNKNINKQNNEM